MDLLFFHKAEKDSNPIPRCNLLQMASKLFRFLHLCFLLASLSWILSRLPIAAAISAHYAAKLIAFAATPLFGFLLCNAIIVALLQFSHITPATHEPSDRIYENLILTTGTAELPEVVYQDKQIISESAISSIHRADPDPDPESGFGDRKVMWRTLSEKLKPREPREKLRRSETEVRRNLERSPETWYFEEDLSGEEFQRRIEEFIAKEKRFRREESSAIVLLLPCDGSSLVQK